MSRDMLLILLVASLLGLAASPVAAETKCEVNTSTCIDARTGQVRVCSTTICRDDKGQIISIQTIVLRDGGGGLQPVKPKLPRGAAGTSGLAKQQ